MFRLLFARRRLVVSMVVLLAVIGLAALPLLWGFRSEAQPSRGSAVGVVGTLVAATGAAGISARRFTNDVELPDIPVYLLDRRGKRAAEGVTQLDGRFSLFAPAGQRYRFCYRIAEREECGPATPANAGTATLNRVAIRTAPSVFGRVLTRDGRACWMNDAFFGVDVSTLVSAAAGDVLSRPRAAVRANVQGEYAIFGLKRDKYRITARCEAASVTGTLASVGRALDLTLPNSAPVLRSAAAMDGARGRKSALVEQTLDLRAEAGDPDGDPVQYLWRALGNSGTITSGGGPVASWALPKEPGFRSVYLLARDGRGGFAFKRIDMQVARDNRVTVSGRAVDETTGSPVANAVVTFAGARGRTDANGWFLVEGQGRAENRYVLNIEHPDYALLSQLLDGGMRGNTYELLRAQVTRVSLPGENRIVDRGSGGFCGRAANQRERPLVRRAPREVVGAAASLEGEGRNLSAERLLALQKSADRDCISRGAQIVLPEEGLVGPGGRRIDGAVRAAITTLNPARRALPGDYRARSQDGGETALASYGAVDVRFTDADGRELNLRRGSRAEVRIPVPPSQAGSAAETVPMWSYDEKDGRWIAEGKAKLQSTPEGLFYVGETSHFSVINMDIELDPTKATCVRVELDPAFSSWSNLVLKAYATFGGGTASQVYETPLNSDQYHRIAALPYGTSFPPNTLRLELRGTFNGVQQVILDNIINTDARPRMTGTNLFPPYPYTECGAPILLTPAPGVVPYYGISDATGRPVFLTGPNGTFNPNPGKGSAYYAAIDPTSAKTTLGGWWQANGFGPLGDGAGNASFTRASYMNHNDLGFGRDMHCLTNAGNKLACYVTNYGAPDQNDQNSVDAENRNPLTQGATVTMEFDPAAGIEAVQFYVFNGGTAAAPRAEFADLDGLGPKPVPHLCMVCHGGQFNANKVRHARFREFDLPSFRYSSNRSWDFGQGTLSTTELGNFAKLNQFVRNAHSGTPIGNLIDNWYPGGFAGSPAPVLPAPPSGWSGQAAGYHAVYGNSCRTCHVARDAPFDFTFSSFGAFSSVDYAVCGFGIPKLRTMPNAYVTYRNFWTNTPRVQQFEALTSVPTGTCGS
ncbi:MAG TPA: hypothetical protein VK403_00225 [Allosphingosinicella sp.]|nr:hypothetical protein [Allosphingosinicella sp.]